MKSIGGADLKMSSASLQVLCGYVAGPHLIVHLMNRLTTNSVMYICSTTQYHKTALHHAVERGHRETVQLLLEKGADPDVQLQDLVGVLVKSS